MALAALTSSGVGAAGGCSRRISSAEAENAPSPAALLAQTPTWRATQGSTVGGRMVIEVPTPGELCCAQALAVAARWRTA